MGRVYKAIDRKLSRYVAIKVLRSADEFEASRFRGEAALSALTKAVKGGKGYCEKHPKDIHRMRAFQQFADAKSPNQEFEKLLKLIDPEGVSSQISGTGHPLPMP